MLSHSPQTTLHRKSSLQFCLHLSGPTLHKEITCGMLAHGKETTLVKKVSYAMSYQPCWHNIAQEYCLVSVVQRHQTTLHNEITCTLLAQSTQIYFTGKPAFFNMPEYAMPVCLLGIVCKGVPAPLLCKALTPCISLAPLFKNL